MKRKKTNFNEWTTRVAIYQSFGQSKNYVGKASIPYLLFTWAKGNWLIELIFGMASGLKEGKNGKNMSNWIGTFEINDATKRA